MFEYKNECSSNELNDYVIIDWSASKIFTLFENFKRVTLGDLVTCIVNNNKDIGTVVFTGSQQDCKLKFAEYKRSLNQNYDKNVKSNIRLNTENSSLSKPIGAFKKYKF